MVLLAGSLMAADKDDVSAAIAKLAAADNYSWKSTVANPAGGGGGRRGGFGAGPVDGKAQKNGLIFVSLGGRGGGPGTDAFVQSTNGAMKTEDGWQSLADATKDEGDGGFNPARFMAMRLQAYKAPAAEAKDLLAKTKSIAKADDVYSGDLTEEGAKAFLSFGPPRGGGEGPEISGAKGSVKFWLKDGVLSKYEIKVQGTISFNGNDRDVDRTTTIEIKDVGTTKIEVPDEAKKKLS